MTQTQLLGIVLTGLVSTGFGTSAVAAQTVLPFEGLSTAVHVGEQVTIAQAGSQTKGVVTAIDAAILRVTDDAGRDRVFTQADVDRLRVHDSVANGAWLGALAGSVPGAVVGRLVYGSCMGDRSSVAKCLPAFAAPMLTGSAVGALVGLVFDDLSQRAIDVRPAGAVVRAAPWLDRRGGGLVLHVSY